MISFLVSAHSSGTSVRPHIRQTVGIPTVCTFSDELFTVFYQPAEVELHIMAGNNGVEEIRLPPKVLTGKHIPDLQGVTGSNRKAEVYHLHMNDRLCIGQIDIGQCKLAAGQVAEKGIG